MANECKSRWSQTAGGSLEDVYRDYREARDPNYTAQLQTSFGEIRISVVDDLINPGNVVPELRGDQADEPVVVRSGQMTQNECWAKFARVLVSLREREENDLALLNH